MKKIFGISLVAVLAGLPMLANAAAGDVNKDPTHTDATTGVTAQAAPKYALAPADTANDGKVATAGYVKGAYNAAIKGVNKLHEEVAGLDTTYATKTGVVNTINATQIAGSFSSAQMNNASLSDATFSGTVSGTASGTLVAMSEWDALTTSALDVSGSITNGSVSGTAGGNINGYANGNVTGTLSVASYVAQ